MKNFVRLFTFAVLSLTASISFSQLDRRFFAPPIPEYQDQPFQIVLSTPFPSATVNVQTPGGAYNQNFTVVAGTPTIIDFTTQIPALGATYGQLAISNLNAVRGDAGFIITSNVPVAAYLKVNRSNNQEIIPLKGSVGLGTRFRVASQTQGSQGRCGSNAEQNSHFVSVMATRNGTTVTFFNPNAGGWNGAGGNPRTFALDSGQSVAIRTNDGHVTNQISGALVTSNFPISVISGGNHLGSFTGPACDAGIDNLVPTNQIGTQYVVVRGDSTNVAWADYIIVVADVNGTQVFFNGTSIGTINAGQYLQYQLPSGPYGTPHLVTTSQPAYLYHVSSQFCTEVGMSIIPQLNCTGNRYVNFVRQPNLGNNVYVIIPTSAVSSFKLNNQPASFYGVTPQVVPGLPAFSTLAFHDTHIASNNIMTADENFHVGILAGNYCQTGLYGFLTGYDRNIEILDPATNIPTNSYQLNTVCSGVTQEHCLRLRSCAYPHDVISVSVISGSNFTATSYSPAPGLPDTCIRFVPTTPFRGCGVVRVRIQNPVGAVDSVDITVCWDDPGISLSIVSPPVCTGGNLTLQATASGGLAPYTYSWSGPGGFTAGNVNPLVRPNATLAMSGVYTVTATDARGCTSTASINVTVNQTPSAPTNVTASPNPVCVGQSFTLTASGQSGATFNWTGPDGYTATGNPVTRTNATTAMQGTYTVTQTVNGCTSSGASVTVTVITPPTISFVSQSNPTTCGGTDGSITIGGLAANTNYAVSYSRNGTPQGPFNLTSNSIGQIVISGLNAGTYSSIFVSIGGCNSNTLAGPFNLSDPATPPPPTNVTASPNPICVGGVLTLNASGTNLSWTGPAGFTASGAPVTRNITTTAHGGTYSVTQTVAGCTSNPATINVTVNPTPTVTASSSSNTYCTGQTIQLSSTPAGGTTPISYSWTGPASFTASTQNPTRPNAQTNHSGVYSVTVTDANGCTASASTQSITVNQSPTVTASSSSAAYCAGTTIQLNSTASGGTSFTYSWSGPAGFTSTDQNPTRPNAQPSHSGVYSVTVTNNFGCSASAQTTSIVVNPAVTVTAGSNSPVCVGGTLNLTATPSGGTSPFTYSWTGPASFSSSAQNPSRPNVVAAFAGTYSVTVTDFNGCSATASTNVVVNTGVAVTASSNSPVCVGATLNLNATPTGGNSPFTYTWSGPASYSATGQNPTRPNIQTSHAGTYSVTITDVNGCTGSASTNVVVNTNPSVTAGSNSPVCSGATINLTSSPSGGATPYSFAWSGPASFSSTLQNPTRPSATTAHSGTYSVTVTDNNGCTATASTSVTVNPSPSVTVSSNSPVCETRTINLTATPSGGTGTYTYNWSGPSSFSSSLQNPSRPNATSAFAGTYSLTVTDGNGCTATASTSVVVLPKPAPPTASAFPNPVCTGQTLNLTGTGNGSATWNWFGPNSFSSTLQNPTITNVQLVNAGTYYLYQTLNGCSSDTAQVTVTVNVTPAPPIITSVNPNPACTGQNVTFTASGAPSSVFNWSGPGFSATGNPVVLNNVQLSNQGNYTVTQTVTGCVSQSSAPVFLTVNQTPTAPTPTSNSPRCWGDTLKLFASTVSGATYSWSGPGGFTSSAQNPVRPNATPSMSGVYSLTVTVSGCSSTNTATVNAVVNSCPPVANDDTYTTNEDVPLTVSAPGVLANDFDPANPQQPLTVSTSPVSGPSNGTLTLNPNGSFTYTPNPNFNGTDVFCYRVCDTEVPAACDTACVTINVVPINDPPVVNDSTVTTPEDIPINVCLPIADPESATQLHNATLCGVTNGTVSGLSVNNGPIPHTVCLTYTPNPNFNGSGQVCVVVCDNGSPVRCDTARITINITPVNDPPVAVNDNYTTNEDVPLVTTVSTGVRNNDNDAADGNPVTSLTVNTTPFVAPSHGTLVLNGNGSFTYTPNANFCGQDSFVYTVCDAGTPLPSLCANATAYITVNCTNDPPVVRDSTVTTPEDVPITVCLPITDPESATQLHSVTQCGGPANGTLGGTLGVNNGTNPHTVCFTYTPNPNFNGTDQVCLVICDNGSPARCDTAIVTINVTPVNDKPVANDDYYTNCTGSNITGNVLANDIDIDGPLLSFFGTISGPFSGTLSISGTGAFTYTPPSPLFNGIDSFIYVVCDGGSPVLCDTATAVLDYRCVNVPPVANNDNYTVPEDGVLTISAPGVMANDFDPDGGIITVSTPQITGPSNGTLTLNSNGSFTYTPNPNFNGLDTFVYRICDNGSPVKCDTAFVFITVTPVNDPPVVPDTSITTCEDCPITTCLPITDVDPGQSYYVAGAVCGPNNGTYTTSIVSLPTNQVCVTYNPNPNYNGLDSICLVVCDNGTPNRCDTTKIKITVTPVNDKPIANDDAYTTNEDTPLNIPAPGVLANDSDPADGTAVSVVGVVSGPSNGTLTLNPNGSFTYVPNPNFSGIDVFCYRITDSGTPAPFLFDTACVTITVNGQNDP
ncbi:MAG: Ig-like domain-containing protein, partial [Chitinophagales bacterium]|nr:Ig-like domain-containing protein [Chitinophagales bacterium]